MLGIAVVTMLSMQNFFDHFSLILFYEELCLKLIWLSLYEWIHSTLDAFQLTY
jgi:hypothetical protein